LSKVNAVAVMTTQPDRLDRIEANLERSTQLLERVINVQETQQNQLQLLTNAVVNHEAMISRLDALLERLIYREGRNDST
jgi:uncharacterized membrane-anchored protein